MDDGIAKLWICMRSGDVDQGARSDVAIVEARRLYSRNSILFSRMSSAPHDAPSSFNRGLFSFSHVRHR